MAIDEKAQVYADRDWWRSAGDVLGLELRGWTFRNEASFADKETGRPVEVPGWLAERIIAYESAKQKEAEGWVLVPREPTVEMLRAWREARPASAKQMKYGGWSAPSCDWDRARYFALISAAGGENAV